MGSPKALLPLEGEPFVCRIARRLRAAGATRVLLITGFHADAIEAATAHLAYVEPLRSPDPDGGQLVSLQAAISACQGPGLLATLVDHPDVAESTYRALFAAGINSADIAQPTHAGRRGHPVWWGRSVFAEILEADREQGARVVTRAVPGRVVEVAVDDGEIHRDVDRPEDYAKMTS